MERPGDPNSTPPKLSFALLPAKKPDPPGMATPPLRAPASVPFSWEEAPGRPRKAPGLYGPASSPRPGPSPRVRRGLQLPPGMVAGGMKAGFSPGSPTTVLEGPDVLSRSLACYSFAFGEERPVKRAVKRKEERVTWSWRQGRGRKARRDGNRRTGFGGFFDGFSSSSSSRSSSSYCDGGDGVGNGEKEDGGGKVRITRFRRSKSLSRASSYSTSTLWAGIFGSLKLVVPWRKDHKY